MKKRTAFIGAILSLIPLGKPLLINTGVVLSTTVFMLAVPENAFARKNANYYFNRAYDKAEKGDHYGAISDYTKAIEINPNDSEAYYNRGWNKGKLKDHYGAISDYTKAIELNSAFADAYYNRGHAKVGLNDYSGAISDFTKVIEINPQYVSAYNNIAFIKRNKEINDNYGAIYYATKAIEINPNHSNGYYNRGFAKKNIGDMKGACADWRKAFSLGNEYASQLVRYNC